MGMGQPYSAYRNGYEGGNAHNPNSASMDIFQAVSPMAYVPYAPQAGGLTRQSRPVASQNPFSSAVTQSRQQNLQHLLQTSPDSLPPLSKGYYKQSASGGGVRLIPQNIGRKAPEFLVRHDGSAYFRSAQTHHEFQPLLGPGSIQFQSLANAFPGQAGSRRSGGADMPASTVSPFNTALNYWVPQPRQATQGEENPFQKAFSQLQETWHRNVQRPDLMQAPLTSSNPRVQAIVSGNFGGEMEHGLAQDVGTETVGTAVLPDVPAGHEYRVTDAHNFGRMEPVVEEVDRLIAEIGKR